LTRHDVTLCLMWITIHQKSVDKCRQSPIDNRSIIDWLSINNELIRSSAVVRQRGAQRVAATVDGAPAPAGVLSRPAAAFGWVRSDPAHLCRANGPPRQPPCPPAPLNRARSLLLFLLFCCLFVGRDQSCPNNIAILNCKPCHLKQRRKLHTQQCLACKCLLLAPRHCAWRGDLWDYERAFTHAENYRHGRGGW
jgi:hypothetical protein